MSSDNNYKPLNASLKGRYPFRLGTTSFIYPDDYSENVRMLAPFLDEVELLFFESRNKESLPDKNEISALLSLKDEYEVSYNIHLPTDISISEPGKIKQQQAIDLLKHTFEVVEPLSPTTCTLHIPCDTGSSDTTDRNKWVDTVSYGLEKLIASGMSSRMISVENLMYPYDWFEPIVKDFDLSVTMDIGHLIVRHMDISSMYDMFSDRITMIHLHGVDRKGDKAKDHVSIAHLENGEVDKIREIFKSYKNGVSIEVFSFDNLQSSLECFSTFF